MKTHTLLLFIFSIYAFNAILGQEQKKDSVKRINIQNLYIHTGFFVENKTKGTLSDFNTLAPNSKILSELATYSLSTYSGGGLMGLSGDVSEGTNLSNGRVYSILLGIQLSDIHKTSIKANPLIRFGISYFSAATLTYGFIASETHPIDTLSGSFGTYYVFDQTRKNLNINYVSDQIRLDGSTIFRTSPKFLLSVYSGIGITAGVSIKSYTAIYCTTEEIIYDDQVYTNVYSDNAKHEVEIIKNKTNFQFSSYLPIGFDFRFSKKKKIWKLLHFFDEFRFGCNTTYIPELRNITHLSLQNAIGLRLS